MLLSELSGGLFGWWTVWVDMLFVKLMSMIV